MTECNAPPPESLDSEPPLIPDSRARCPRRNAFPRGLGFIIQGTRGQVNMNESSVSGFLAEMADGIKSGSMAGHIEWLPARQARYRQPKRELHPQVVAAENIYSSGGSDRRRDGR